MRSAMHRPLAARGPTSTSLCIALRIHAPYKVRIACGKVIPMALRHRVPTVFSIYMVDVLCCALGCVILLWQVNYQEAEKQTAAAQARGDALQNSLDKLK